MSKFEHLEKKVNNFDEEQQKIYYSQKKQRFSDSIWKLKSVLDENCKFYCKCGHSLYIYPPATKRICNWCGLYVFKDKKEEFNYRLKQYLK